MRFENKVALITGGVGGIGAETARLLVNEGAKVAIADILEDQGKQLADELGDRAKYYSLDVRKADQWQAVVADIEKELGALNILVNNAGIAFMKPILSMTEDEYRRVIDINQVGAFLGMKQVLPAMIEAKSGNIINVSSLAGFRGSEFGSVAYAASKFALRGMTKAVALEMARFDIRVNTVHPGLIKTPLTFKEGYEEVFSNMTKVIPMGRGGTPQEVAKLIAFLVSEDASFSTGCEYILDGGQLAKL